MRYLLLVLFYVFFALPGFSTGKTDSLLSVLKVELSRKNIYDDEKKFRIEQLRKLLAATARENYHSQYNICSKLYQEYKVYQFDSAYVYTQKLIDICKHTGDQSALNDSKIRVSFLLLSAGMFKETFESLNLINPRLLSIDSKIEYYAIKSRAYSDLGDYNGDKTYAPDDKAESVKYIDSAIMLSKQGSFAQLYNLGDRQVITGQLEQPSPYYSELLAKYNLTGHQRAMVATGLSYFYNAPDQTDERVFLMTEGAINDIRSSTKETLAIFLLGKQLYKDGNVKDAYTFMQQAMDDARFYGARLRKIQVGAVLPVIADQNILVAENEKNRFLVYLLSIGAFALLIALVSFIVFIQLKKVKVKERIIEEKNALLEKING